MPNSNSDKFYYYISPKAMEGNITYLERRGFPTMLEAVENAAGRLLSVEEDRPINCRVYTMPHLGYDYIDDIESAFVLAELIDRLDKKRLSHLEKIVV